MDKCKNVKYAGFGIRALASLIDTFVMALPIAVVVYFISGGEWFDFAAYQANLQAAMSGNPIALNAQPQTNSSWEALFEGLTLLITVIFWRRWMGATPGKHFVGIKIVDKESCEIVTTKESIIRVLGYFVTTFLFFIAIPMMILRKDKRTIHDLLAGTAVIYDENNSLYKKETNEKSN